MHRTLWVLGAIGLCWSLVSASSGEVTLVACAPGYPGDTEQAQETMDAFAAGVARAAGWGAGKVGAVYHAELDEGLERLSRAEAMIALVPLPFYLEYRERLSLAPLLEVVQQAGSREVWSVVARRGAVEGPSSLAGWELAGMPGYSPRFVREVALGEWGALPADSTVSFSSRVLSVLRKAARGEPVAALLDTAQTAALDSLSFADQLEVVTQSAALPATLVCRVGDGLDDAGASGMADGLLRMHEMEGGAELLESIRIVRFTTLDAGLLRALEEGFDGAGE